MNRTIVLIERDPCILNMLTSIFINQGFIVKSMMFQEGALQTLIEVNPCCVVIDIIRVTELGTRLCRQIKYDLRTNHIPVIALSTQTEAKDLKGVWADEVVLKPFDIDDVIAAVEKQWIFSCPNNLLFEYQGAN